MKKQIGLAGVFIILKFSLLGCAVGTLDTIEPGDKLTQIPNGMVSRT